MTTFPPKTVCRLILILSLITLAAGCTPKKYIAADGKELILKQEYENQVGGIDPAVATRCMEGNTKVYVKLQGDKYNPCVELGIFLINNHIPEDGIPFFEKGIKAVSSYNADESVLRTENIGIMQSTHLANVLYDLCMKKPVYNLSDGSDITAVICEKAGELFEKVKYRENAIVMYRKKCELSGKCNELKRLEEPIKK